MLVHDNGVCTEDFVAFMKVLEDKMGDKFHPYLVDLLFHAGLDPADEVEVRAEPSKPPGAGLLVPTSALRATRCHRTAWPYGL